ncbi:hypothetical protein B0H14DRAFT_3170398 [Mycena olivaceomarginata]|nr:hypothetical protein B0H14DRAFT_3170398 [Mycena olivaceomarginata]
MSGANRTWAHVGWGLGAGAGAGAGRVAGAGAGIAASGGGGRSVGKAGVRGSRKQECRGAGARSITQYRVFCTLQYQTIFDNKNLPKKSRGAKKLKVKEEEADFPMSVKSEPIETKLYSSRSITQRQKVPAKPTPSLCFTSPITFTKEFLSTSLDHPTNTEQFQGLRDLVPKSTPTVATGTACGPNTIHISQSTIDDTCWAEVCFGEDVVEEEVTVDEADAGAFVSNPGEGPAPSSPMRNLRKLPALCKWTLEVPKLYDPISQILADGLYLELALMWKVSSKYTELIKTRLRRAPKIANTFPFGVLSTPTPQPKHMKSTFPQSRSYFRRQKGRGRTQNTNAEYGVRPLSVKIKNEYPVSEREIPRPSTANAR